MTQDVNVAEKSRDLEMLEMFDRLDEKAQDSALTVLRSLVFAQETLAPAPERA